MKNKLFLNKPRGLYGKAIVRLWEIKGNHNFIPWTNVREKLGRGFSIKKDEIRELILFLENMGFVEISFRGVKLNFEVKNE